MTARRAAREGNGCARAVKRARLDDSIPLHAHALACIGTHWHALACMHGHGHAYITIHISTYQYISMNVHAMHVFAYAWICMNMQGCACISMHEIYAYSCVVVRCHGLACMHMHVTICLTMNINIYQSISRNVHAVHVHAFPCRCIHNPEFQAH